MPLTAIVVQVTRPGPRADELLAAVSSRLGQQTHAPDERGHVRLLLEQGRDASWQRVHDALQAAGDDWQEHLQLHPLHG